MDLSNEDIVHIKKSVNAKVGNNIRSIRKEKGMSQVELADKIQSDRQYLYKIEHGKVGISVVKLAIIAKALDVPSSALVDGI